MSDTAGKNAMRPSVLPSIGTAGMQVQRQAAPLRRKVVDEIRKAIVTDVFPPGTRLVERLLVERLQVSRTVVRESLRQLEAEQLIEMVPNVGPVVRTLTPAEARNLYEVRSALESLAVRSFVEHADDAQIAQLGDALAAIVAAGDDVPTRLELQDAFLAGILDGAGNPVLGDILGTIHSRMSRLRAMTLTQGGFERQKSGLSAVFAAIRRRDAEGAEAAMRSYVRVAADAAMQVLPDSL